MRAGYQPVVWLDRPVPLYERIALYSVAACAVVTCVRDGMNLVPYEYTVCREGVQVRRLHVQPAPCRRHTAPQDAGPEHACAATRLGCARLLG